MKDGFGRMKFSTGAFYIGEWCSGNIDGFGHYKWPNEKQYTGNFSVEKL